jgi:small subunit ribosomal protein S18
MYEADIGGVCEGKKQRRGSQPLRCKKVDLNEVAFTNVAVLAQFLSPVGLIKPRRMSGLCAKCQRKVARTVKQARHLGVLPHTSGVDLYQRLKGEGEEAGGGGFDPAAGVASAPLLSRRGGGGGREGGREEELLKKIPSLTI